MASTRSPVLKSQHRLEPKSDSFPLHVLASKYWTAESDKNVAGYTLILLHAVGLHKETWEVMIDSLFDLDISQGSILRDVFSIEIPNHGESAAVNEAAILKYYADEWPTRLIAQATHAFLSAGPTEGARIDFTKRNLVGVGHSIGAAAMFLMHDIEPKVPFQSIIAVEPGISVKDLPATAISSQMLTAWTWLRPDVWSSRKSAKKSLATSPVQGSWDERVLDLFVKHGLRTHPATNYAPPFNFDGVITCASRAQEAACYRSEHLVVDAMNAYTAYTRDLPIHVLFGTVHDVGNPELQALLTDEKAGRKPASVSYVEGAGHLAVQQQPEAVAEAVYKVLQPPSRPRL